MFYGELRDNLKNIETWDHSVPRTWALLGFSIWQRLRLSPQLLKGNGTVRLQQGPRFSWRPLSLLNCCFLYDHGSLALPNQSCLLLCYSLEEFLPRNLLFKSASVPAFPRRANIANLSPFTLGNPILFDGLCCALHTCLQYVLFQAHHSLPISHLCILLNL